MSTFLFTWNPTAWPWLSFAEDRKTLGSHGTVTVRWAISAHKDLETRLGRHEQVRALMMRTGKKDEGIVGSGKIVKPAFQAASWKPKSADKMIWYVEIHFQQLSDQLLIGRKKLRQIAPTTFKRIHMQQGYSIEPDSDAEAVWKEIHPATDQNSNKLPRVLMKSPNIILYGPPGTGKTYSTVSVAAQLLSPDKATNSWSDLLKIHDGERKNWQGQFSAALGKRIHFITFHQSYSYEDFIGGLRPVARPKTITTPDQAQPANPNSDGGSLQFEWTAGIFLRACAAAFKEAQNQMATKWPTGNQTHKDDVESFLEFCGQAKLESYKEAEGKVYPFVILVIDEINRANMSRVFGELITLLEEDKRLGGKEQLIVQLPNRPDCKFGVPKNLIIIGTMNTADKSLALLDLALRRRFEFHRLDPIPEKVENATLRQFMKALNEAIAKERKSLDYGIGHAYFMRGDITVANLKDVLTDILQRKIVPLLQEYFGGDDAKVIKVLRAANVDLEAENFGLGTDRDPLIKMPIKVVKCPLPQPTPPLTPQSEHD